MKYELYEVFKDDFDPRFPWRVQMPKGRWPFRLKREAQFFAKLLKETDAKEREEESASA